MDEFEAEVDFGEDEEEYEVSGDEGSGTGDSDASDASGSDDGGDDDEYGMEGIEQQSGEEDEGEENAAKLKPNLALADAMGKILSQSVGGEVPILAKSKGSERRLEKEKVEAKERRRRLAEKRLLMEKGRVKPDVLKIDKERRLVRVATRGVVKLFNAVAKQQKATAPTAAKAPSKAGVNAMTKENFLSMLKSHAE